MQRSGIRDPSTDRPLLPDSGLRPASGLRTSGVGWVERSEAQQPPPMPRTPPVGASSLDQATEPAATGALQSRVGSPLSPRLRITWIGRVSPRRATYFLACARKISKEAQPASAPPAGVPALRRCRAGCFANSPCGLKQRSPSFRPPPPPVGATEGGSAVPTPLSPLGKNHLCTVRR